MVLNTDSANYIWMNQQKIPNPIHEMIFISATWDEIDKFGGFVSRFTKHNVYEYKWVFHSLDQ